MHAVIISILVFVGLGFGSGPKTVNIECSGFSMSHYNNLHLNREIDTLIIAECGKIDSLPRGIEKMNLSCLHFYWVGKGDVLMDYSPIGGISTLEELKLGPYGTIEQLPDSFKKLKSLRRLDLRLTSIRELPDWISELSSLEEINLSMTPLKALPILALKHLKNLKVINLMDSDFASDEDKIQELRSALSVEIVI